MNLKEKIKSFRNSDHLFIRMIYFILKPFWRIRRFSTDSYYRSVVITGLRSRNKYYQRSSFTKTDRYPLVFAACTHYLRSISQPHVLSFGCATGEEAATLGKYMPVAMITGADVNEWCIRTCRDRYKDHRFRFFNRHSDEFNNCGGFDAIFCMAVFQHTTNRLNKANETASNITFSQFEEELKVLDARLNNGGLLVIDNCDFSFTDTAIAVYYKPLAFPDNLIVRARPLFDRNNRKISETQHICRVFVKDGK